MKVFISWSGQRSRAVAVALKEWLPIVLEGVEPWVSDKDISAGERWAQSIAGELEAANFGVICITPENLNADWILFESGALSKSMQDAKVIPLLFDLDFSDVSGPLAQFQAKKLEKDGMREVVQAINRCSEKPTAEEVVGKRFDPLWSTFEESLKKVPAREPSEKSKRTQTQVLEELVSTVRSLEARFRDLSSSVDPGIRNSKRRRPNPELYFNLMEITTSDDIGSSLLLPAFAGAFRDEAPWVSEILMDAYRDLSDATKARNVIGQRKLRDFLRLVEAGHPVFRDLSESKDAYFMLRDMSHLMERVLRIDRDMPDLHPELSGNMLRKR